MRRTPMKLCLIELRSWFGGAGWIFNPGSRRNATGYFPKSYSLPARSPASRSLAEGRRFGEGRGGILKGKLPRFENQNR